MPKAYVIVAEGWAPDAVTAKAIFAHSRDVLASYKRVRVLEFSELPKTVSGKIRRIDLRQQAEHPSPQEFRAEDFR